MAREFTLVSKAPNLIKHSDGSFMITPIGDDEYMLKRYDHNGDIENTLFFTQQELKCLFLLLSREAGDE